MTTMPGWRPAMEGHTPYFATAAEPRSPSRRRPRKT